MSYAVNPSPTRLTLRPPTVPGSSRSSASFPTASPSPSPTPAALDHCPHCGRKAIVKNAPRCSFCGESLQAGVKSWKAVETEAATAGTGALATGPRFEVVPPDVGYTAEQRAQACSRLRGFFLRSKGRAEIVELFVGGLQNDFSVELAEHSSSCKCDRLADTILAVEWSARIDLGAKFDLITFLLLPFGLLTYKKQWMDYHVTTFHAACTTCAGRKGWFDRYERFFGRIPSVLRRGKVHRFPFAPAAAEANDRGSDLCHHLTITQSEEVQGFTRTLPFLRSLALPGAVPASQAITEVAQVVTMARGWATAHLRRTNSDFHYALRLRGGGNRGQTPGNDGDLFVTITVQD